MVEESAEASQLVARFGELWTERSDELDSELFRVFLLYETDDFPFDQLALMNQTTVAQVVAMLYRARFFMGEAYARMRVALELPPLAAGTLRPGPSPAEPPRLRDDPDAPPLMLWGLEMQQLVAERRLLEMRRPLEIEAGELEGERAEQLQEARRAQASPDRLAELAKSSSRAVRAQVAPHPRTPPSSMLALASEYPAEVAHHPAMLVAARTSVESFSGMPTGARTVLYGLPDLREFWWELGARHLDSELRQTVAMALGCPPRWLEELALDEEEAVRSMVAAHPHTPPAWLERLARDRARDVRRGAARNAALPQQSLERLSADEDPEVARAAVSHPRCPSAALENASRHPDPAFRKGAASNPSSPRPLLERLASDPDPGVVEYVVSNRACPAPWLERWARDERMDIRVSVARNAACAELLLRELGADPEALVRCLVACHLACPGDLLEALANDDDEVVRGTVASHRASPLSLLERLARDPDPDVRRAVGLNASTPLELRALVGITESDLIIMRMLASFE